MSADFGTDWDTSSDLGFTPVSGVDALKQAIIRSLKDADAGVDLGDWLNEDMDAAKAFELQRLISGQVALDERVDSATVTVRQLTMKELSIDIEVVPSIQGEPFKLTLKVTDLSVGLLTGVES